MNIMNIMTINISFVLLSLSILWRWCLLLLLLLLVLVLLGWWWLLLLSLLSLSLLSLLSLLLLLLLLLWGGGGAGRGAALRGSTWGFDYMCLLINISISINNCISIRIISSIFSTIISPSMSSNRTCNFKQPLNFTQAQLSCSNKPLNFKLTNYTFQTQPLTFTNYNFRTYMNFQNNPWISPLWQWFMFKPSRYI